MTEKGNQKSWVEKSKCLSKLPKNQDMELVM